MTWVDVLLVVGLGILVYSASRRGMILELGDLVVAVASLAATWHLYRRLAHVFVQKFNWQQGFSNVMAFWIVFVPIAVIVYVIVLAVDRAVNDGNFVKTNKVLGFFVGIPKAMLVLWIMLLVCGMLNTSAARRAPFEQSALIRALSMLNGPIESAVSLLAPADVAHDLNGTIETVAFTGKETPHGKNR